jgi:hypothetical protein
MKFYLGIFRILLCSFLDWVRSNTSWYFLFRASQLFLKFLLDPVILEWSDTVLIVIFDWEILFSLFKFFLKLRKLNDLLFQVILSLSPLYSFLCVSIFIFVKTLCKISPKIVVFFIYRLFIMSISLAINLFR